MAAVRERYFISHKSIDAKTNKTRIGYRSLLRKMGIIETKELPKAGRYLRPMRASGAKGESSSLTWWCAQSFDETP